MSFDIIILKPTNLSENDLSNVEDVLDIGCHEAVITFLELVFLDVPKVHFRMVNATRSSLLKMETQ